MKIPSLLAGVSGEYFVAAELSRRGYIASISLRNTRGIDILATNQAGSRSVTIQVKTNQLLQSSWMLNEKGEDFAPKSHFYVFVVLRELGERPSFYIVPSRKVAASIKAGHRQWLGTLGKKGQQRVDTPMRIFADSEGRYLEKWELLGL